MEQKTVAARNLAVGDLIPFPTGEKKLDMIHLSKLERVIAIGVDPQRDIVEVHTNVANKTFVAVGLPGDTMIRVYREETEEEDNETVDHN